MEVKKFIEEFAELFDDTDVSLFSEETKFKELEEWSSLIALSLIAMVDGNYNIKIRGEDIREADTINDLFAKVKSMI